jgi:hypothetical protein
MEVIAGQAAIDHLDAADLDDAMILLRFEACGFCIKNDLAHDIPMPLWFTSSREL